MIYFGVDIGGTGIKVGAVSPEGKLLHMDSAPTQAALGYEVLAADIASLINKVMADNGISLDEISYIGFGSPGILDNEKGTVTDNSNIHWENYPIRDKIQKQINKPIYMGNDANVAAWAEYISGCGKGNVCPVVCCMG